jgi:hypothetical protein
MTIEQRVTDLEKHVVMLRDAQTQTLNALEKMVLKFSAFVDSLTEKESK